MDFNDLINQCIHIFQSAKSDYTYCTSRYKKIVFELNAMKAAIQGGFYPRDYPVLPLFHFIDRNIDPPEMYEAIEKLDNWYAINYMAKSQAIIRREQVKNYLLSEVKMSEQDASTTMNKLAQYKEIYLEFSEYVSTRKFPRMGVSVCGYNAATLHRNYSLSPLGAYNYLIYLQEKPEEALANLKVQEIEELKPYQEQLQRLYSQGMSYWGGVKKSYVGKVDRKRFFNEPGRIVNTFGYYQDDDNTWFAFVTDEERGLQDTREKLSSEEEAIEYLIDLTKRFNFSHYYHLVMDNFADGEKIIINHLKKKYNYSEDKAQKTLSYLLQVKIIAFEYFYLIKHGKYVPDRFAMKISGYTAKRLKQETSLTELGAFNYMVYLKKKPEEALANLKKGLPRLRLLSPQDIDDLKKYMD